MIEHWTDADAAPWLPAPGPADSKYRRGVLGVRAGSAQYPGAAVLAVSAGWRTGVGLLRYVPPIADQKPPFGLPAPAAAVLAARPETVFGDSGAHPCDAWLLGSGTDPSTRSPAEHSALLTLLSGSAPAVIDAGALELAAEARSGTLARAGGADVPGAPLIFTPHAGEFARLWKQCDLGDPPAALADPATTTARGDAARRLAEALGATVLLKGSVTVIATPRGGLLSAGPATPRLATAGTGDVLAGVLGALVALHAARVREDPELLGALGAAAALLHDQAARLAAGSQDRPIVALDVATALPAAVAAITAR